MIGDRRAPPRRAARRRTRATAARCVVCAASVFALPLAAAQPGATVKIEAAPGPGRPTAAAAAARAQRLTPNTIATKSKPKGFRYSILRNVWVNEVALTALYVKKNKRSRTGRTVPIPKDRELLASCITGGAVTDLTRAAIVTVKFDPAGVVRPEIIIVEASQIETLHGKVLDMGGPKLYVALDDRSKRGFAVARYADWDDVVKNGAATDLKRGVPLTLTFDPSGEQALTITLDSAVAAAVPDTKDAPAKGCGCTVTGGRNRTVPLGAVLLLAASVALLSRRRRA